MEDLPVQEGYAWQNMLGIEEDTCRINAGKRLLDILVSLIVLVPALPMMGLAALLIILDSEGPVFYRQVRVGRNGRLFNMLKFRSMVVDAERMLADVSHLNEVDGPVFKIRNDPRVTRVGRLLRKTSIDELPQLFNVMRGEMSLVGPRPPLPAEVALYEDWQLRRLNVVPGITCIWQISGRNDTSFDEWMFMDLEYIDNWSLWLDIKIIIRTIPAVLKGRGAY